MLTEEKAVSTQRDTAIDLLKAAAIIGVLTIHISAGGCGCDIGSWNWCASMFWGSLTRASVPIFLMCSGALLLDPQKRLTIPMLYRKNLLRILIALFFWASAYKFNALFHSAAGCSVQGIIQSIKEVILFQHEFHLYYLHIIILVYVFLPITRILTAGATKQQLRYILAVWFILGIVYPTVQVFWPFTLLSGIPLQWSMNMTYSAVGYGIMGYYLKKCAAWRAGPCLLLFACGFVLVFGGTAAVSFATGTLYQPFLEGMSPGVALMAVGLFGAVTALCRGGRVSAAAEKISKASFCIYLVHMFFIYIFQSLGFTIWLLPSLVSIPILVCAVFVCSYVLYLILSHIPVVNRYLI